MKKEEVRAAQDVLPEIGSTKQLGQLIQSESAIGSSGLPELLESANKSIINLSSRLEDESLLNFLENEKKFNELSNNFYSLMRIYYSYEAIKKVEFFLNLLKKNQDLVKELNVKTAWICNDYGSECLKLDFDIIWSNDGAGKMMNFSGSVCSNEAQAHLSREDEFYERVYDFMNDLDIEHLSKSMSMQDVKEWHSIQLHPDGWIKEILSPEQYSKLEHLRFGSLCVVDVKQNNKNKVRL